MTLILCPGYRARYKDYAAKNARKKGHGHRLKTVAGRALAVGAVKDPLAVPQASAPHGLSRLKIAGGRCLTFRHHQHRHHQMITIAATERSTDNAGQPFTLNGAVAGNAIVRYHSTQSILIQANSGGGLRETTRETTRTEKGLDQSA